MTCRLERCVSSAPLFPFQPFPALPPSPPGARPMASAPPHCGASSLAGSTGKRHRGEYGSPGGAAGRTHLDRRGIGSPSPLTGTGSESRSNGSPLSSGQNSPSAKPMVLRPPTPLSLVGGFNRLVMDLAPLSTPSSSCDLPMLMRKRQRMGWSEPVFHDLSTETSLVPAALTAPHSSPVLFDSRAVFTTTGLRASLREPSGSEVAGSLGVPRLPSTRNGGLAVHHHLNPTICSDGSITEASLRPALPSPRASPVETTAGKLWPDLRIDVNSRPRRSSLSQTVSASSFGACISTAHRHAGTVNAESEDELEKFSPDDADIDPGSGNSTDVCEAGDFDSEMGRRVHSPTDDKPLSPVSRMLLLSRRKR
mgnify:CR=1 FL=1